MGSLQTAIYQYVATPKQDLTSERLDRLDKNLSNKEKTWFCRMPRAFISSYDIGKKIHDRAEPTNVSSTQRLAEIALKKQTVIAVGYPEKDGDIFLIFW